MRDRLTFKALENAGRQRMILFKAEMPSRADEYSAADFLRWLAEKFRIWDQLVKAGETAFCFDDWLRRAVSKTIRERMPNHTPLHHVAATINRER